MDEAISSQGPDFRKIFESLAECYLILKPDNPRFTIVAVSDAYARATNIRREMVVGKGLFEVFPDNPSDQNADGVKNLTASLNRVLASKKIDFMPIQKYDIPILEIENSTFEERYWSPDNSPVMDETGAIVYIIHHVTDVTAQERLLRTFGSRDNTPREHSAGPSQIERLERVMIDRETKISELKDEIRSLKSHA